MIYNASLYLQAVEGLSASAAGLRLILVVVGGLVGSFTGGLTIQATGKFYAITVAAYFLMLLGTGLVVLMTGGVMQSLTGLIVGEIIPTLWAPWH